MAARTAKMPPMELPAFIEPMRARPASPFDSDQHLFEIKWDGTHVLCFVERGGFRLMNRRRRDIIHRYPDLKCLASLPPGTVLDGEIVVLRTDGTPDFAALQTRDQCESPRRIEAAARARPATFIVFDQLHRRYANVMSEPLTGRREGARSAVARCDNPRVVMSEGVTGAGKAYFDAAAGRR